MSLENASRAIQTIEERGFLRHRIYALLNKSRPRETPDLEGFAAMLRHSCHSVFRNDHALYDAYSEGRFLPSNKCIGKRTARAGGIDQGGRGRRDQPGQESPGGSPANGKRWFSFLHKSVAFQETREHRGAGISQRKNYGDVSLGFQSERSGGGMGEPPHEQRSQARRVSGTEIHHPPKAARPHQSGSAFVARRRTGARRDPHRGREAGRRRAHAAQSR